MIDVRAYEQGYDAIYDEYYIKARGMMEARDRETAALFSAEGFSSREASLQADECWDVYKADKQALCDERDAKLKALWDSLGEGITDPLAKWILEHCALDRWEALLVLSRLPMTLPELDALAASKGWCNTWKRYREMAIRDGVISDGAS